MENYNMGAMLDVIMAFFGFSAVSWKEDFGLKLGQAIHLGQVVEQPPDMGRHRRSDRNVGTNWVEAKLICYILHANQFSLRTSVTVTSRQHQGDPTPPAPFHCRQN